MGHNVWLIHVKADHQTKQFLPCLNFGHHFVPVLTYCLFRPNLIQNPHQAYVTRYSILYDRLTRSETYHFVYIRASRIANEIIQREVPFEIQPREALRQNTCEILYNRLKFKWSSYIERSPLTSIQTSIIRLKK